MENREEIKLVFTDDVSIEIRYKSGEIVVWDRGTGYGKASMYDALEAVKTKVGHTTVREIQTVRFTKH
jgi:hypothetical protein